MPAALMVSYPDSAGATFDRSYYIASHLSMVRDGFGPLGMSDVTGYFPEAGTGHRWRSRF